MALIRERSVKCYLHHRSPSLRYTDTRLQHSGQSSAPKYTGHKRAKARDSSWTFDNVSICCGCHSVWGRERGNTATWLTGANHKASGAQKWKEHSPTEDRQECLTFRKMGHKLSQAQVMTKNFTLSLHTMRTLNFSWLVTRVSERFKSEAFIRCYERNALTLVVIMNEV